MSRSTLVILLAVMAGLAVLCALGSWQVQRLYWKEGLLAKIDERIAAEPRPLGEIVTMQQAGQDIEYMPVHLRGRFLHEHEQHFFATHKGASGWYIYTPLELADGSGVVFVNRGFAP